MKDLGLEGFREGVKISGLKGFRVYGVEGVKDVGFIGFRVYGS